MLFLHTGRRHNVLAMVLVLAIISSSGAPLFLCGTVQANDRAADIIGSNPLMVPGLITPLGLTGRGQIIGIADSGLDKGSMSEVHPDLQSDPGKMPRVVMLKSYTDREVPDDPTGHGTHMAATIAGSGKASNGQYHGIAPGASIYFQALLNKASQLQLPGKLEDLFRPAYEAGVRVHVNGWGSGTNSYAANPAQIDNFVYRYPDFLPVFAAGNNGPGNGSLTSEANSKNALVVGSSQVPRPAFGPEARYADQPAASSSRGPAADGRIKPELLAPGSAVVSACSSLVTSNYAANTAYTRLGGSSMAAAVTGGALALLREELKAQNTPSPSAALQKALLVNGARRVTGKVAEEGFGILDLAGTILALQEGNYKYQDEKTGLTTGQNWEYRFTVNNSSTPVKVTLAWTDPAAKSGDDKALVNDLNLSVQAPDGETYYGNDFNAQKTADNVNNIEQISIPDPTPGEYIIRIRAASVAGYGTQPFALAYGQSLPHGIVKSIDNNGRLTLADGRQINLEGLEIHQEVNGQLRTDLSRIEPGSDLYLGSGKAYLFGATWQTGGIQAMSTDEGDLVVEMNNQVREGGYYLDERARDDDSQNIWVNNLAAAGITAIPTGAELNASINPVYQTLWQLQASGQEITGFVEKIDAVEREIKLLRDPQTYKLASWAALSYRDKLVDCAASDIPFGSTRATDLKNLMPGTKVTLLVSPTTKVIQYLQVDRPMVIGKVVAIDPEQAEVRLETGKVYQVLAGGSVYRDKTPVSLDEIEAGDLFMGQLMPDSNTVVQAQAYTSVVYGRVTYYSARQKCLYLSDNNNHAYTFNINGDSQIFAWGIPVDPSALTSGSWVRIIYDPREHNVLNLDIAEVDESNRQTILGFDSQNNILRTEKSRYQLINTTRISKGGYIISAQDLIPGESADITTLLAASSSPSVLANVEVKVNARAEAPTLEIRANSLNGVLVVQGSTSADIVYLYRQDGSRERIEVENGKFSRLFSLLPNEKEIQALALDTRNGGMKAKTYTITLYPVTPVTAAFNDIAGHWAQPYIENLGKKGVISGCGDQNFQPDKTITRSELVTMITRNQKWDWTGVSNGKYFSDNGDIPWWSLKAVLTASEHGLLKGYPDGTFRPLQTITRSELAVIIYALLGGDDKTKPNNNHLPYADSSTIPAWANAAFLYLYNQGLLDMWNGPNLQPWRPVTRAEAAAIIDQINR